jgi:peptide/nickel transport system permease protein
MKNLKRSLQELFRYPSAVAGLVIIFILLLVSLYSLIAIPYGEAIRLWRGNEADWYQNPKYVPPTWINYFRREKLPPTIVLSPEDEEVTTTIEERSDGSKKITYVYQIDFNYDDFPQEIAIYFKASYDQKQPLVSMLWQKPGEEELRLDTFRLERQQTYRFSQDEKLARKLKNQNPVEALFTDPNSDPENPEPLKGTYYLTIEGNTFEPDSTYTAELVIHGMVHGLAGTDHLRRDLTIPLLWGTPVALAFGLVAALGTAVLTMIIAAVGVWFNGWVDEMIQRITEINLILPFLSILIMVGTFYSRSIWTILGITILLSIFTGSIKGYRAIFMQVKESTYIEAARAYGASNTRIIFSYLIPRIIPLLIPGLVSSIPAFVFLEASLAVLGLGDPVLPTWGKIINDAQSNGALYNGLYYWILEPAVLLMITGLAFAMLGFALDRIFNPRLRDI